METIFSYKQSKTINKSLSYLSGVGEDLSFDISYFMRLSACATRYQNDSLFLDLSKRMSLEHKEEFGELIERKLNETSNALSLDKYIRKDFFVHDYSDFLLRSRNTKLDIYKFFDFLSSDTDIDLFARPLFASDNIISGMYTVDSVPIYRISIPLYNSNQLFAKEHHIGGLTSTSNHDFVAAPKIGSQLYSTENNISGKGAESITEQEYILVGGIEEKRTNEFSFSFAKGNDKKLIVDESISFSTETVNIIVDEQYNLESHAPNVMIKEDDLEVDTEDIKAEVDTDYYNVCNRDKTSSYGEVLNIGIPTKQSDINNLYEKVSGEEPEINMADISFIGTPHKGIIYGQQDMVGGKDKEMLVNDFNVNVGQYSKGLIPIYDSFLVDQQKKGIQIDKEGTSVSGEEQEIDVYSSTIAVGGANKGINDPVENEYNVSHHSKGLYNLESSYITTSKYEKGMFQSDSIITTDKNSKGSYGYDNTAVSKWNKAIFSYDDETFDKYEKGQVLYDNDTAWKDEMAFDVYDIFNANRETERGIYSTESSVSFKYARSVNDDMFDTMNVSKSSKGTFDNAPFMIYRTMDKGIWNTDDIIISKALKSSVLDELSDFVIRNIRYGTGYYDTTQLISKSPVSVGGVDTSVLISKSPYTAYSQSTDSWFNKEYRSAYEVDYLQNISKAPNGTTILKHSTNITKSKIDTRVNLYSESVKKNYRNIEPNAWFENIEKNYRPTDETDLSIQYKIPMRNYTVNKLSLMVYKNWKETNGTQSIVPFIPKQRDTNNKPISTRFIPDRRNTKISNSKVEFDTLKAFGYLKQESINVPFNSDTFMNDSMMVKNKDIQDADLNVHVNASPNERDTGIDRVSGFGYIEKPDYALIKDDRIDELLLPEADFNYSNFAKKLFVNGSIEQRYIKRVDDAGNIYINLPIENPIIHFADVATKYMDLNVGMLTYIIEKAYNIWQHNIFTYSATPSDVALNDILKRLRQNLYIQYPSESDQLHLDRAIRLFRWYAEMSILNNAEYMLKLKYKALEVDYASKDLTMFNDIATFKNMYVDNTFVLSAIDTAQPSGFSIKITRGHKVRLRFTAAISGGQCVIIVNGKSDKYAEQMLEFDEELPIGDNTIDIMFTPTSDTSYFGIMKLSIENYSITSYDVSYVGKIGETNMTINYLINMLSVCGDSIDLVQKTVAHATPTANALEQMRVYFDLHHEDKLKGRRLITKH